MKKSFLICCCFAFSSIVAVAQNKKSSYPVPEYSNEIYLLKKGDSLTLVRLEKESSKMKTNTKMGGFGGSNSGYLVEGAKSPIRLHSGGSLSFVVNTGNAGDDASPEADSAMKANGMDPGVMQNPLSMMTDPSQSTSLYNLITDKGNRSIVLQSYQGMKILGKAKKESTKYTFSIKKIKEGYYEMVVDKTLPKGEYAFLVTPGIMATGNTDGSYLLFAFGID